MHRRRVVKAEEIDEWLSALRRDTYWGDEMVSIARATLEAMGTSETAYTGDDLYEVVVSPPARDEFIATESCPSGSLEKTLGAIDNTARDAFSRQVHALGEPSVQ